MKKIYSTIMMFAMIVAAFNLAACSSDDDNGDEGSGTSQSSSSTFKMVSSKGGVYYIENVKGHSIGENRGNLSENGYIWCYLRASKHDEVYGKTSGYFRIVLGGKKSISDFAKGYDLGELDMNFAVGIDYSYKNKFNYVDGSITVIDNNKKGFTLKFDNYVAEHSSGNGWTMTVNGTLYVENEKHE